MADEETGTNSPIGTTEATPPRVEDSLEMIGQPSPEEHRVTSTDGQQFEIADSPDQLISSTTDQEQIRRSDGIESVTLSSAEEGFLLDPNEAGVVEASAHGQSSFDSAPEIENRPQLGALSNNLIALNTEYITLPTRDGPTISLPVERYIILKRYADEFRNRFLQELYKIEQEKDAADSQTRSSRGTAKDTKRNVDEENSDNSEQQFDVDDFSTASKSFPENMDLGNDSSPTEFDAQLDEQRDLGSRVTENADLAGDSSRPNASVEGERNLKTSPIKNVGIENSLGTGATKNVGLENRLGISATENIENKSSPIKTGAVMQDFGKGSAENVRLKIEPSLTTKSAAVGVEESSSTTGVLTSSKCKSATKIQHLQMAPLPSNDRLQGQRHEHMSKLVENLHIIETEESGNSDATSGLEREKSEEMAPPDESRKPKTEQGRNVEMQETDHSSNEDGETAKN